LRARLAPIALEDIERASEWCERKREGLGLAFTERVLESIEKIELNPFGYEKVYSEARKAECIKHVTMTEGYANLSREHIDQLGGVARQM